MGRRLLYLLIALLLAVLIAIWLVWQPAPPPHRALPGTETPVAGDFTLHAAQGDAALHNFRGKVVLLYFGYTWCPDICPTSLALLGQALHGMAPVELEQVQAIFVSVDPARDTVERLAEYVRYFHPSMIGATGTAEQVAEVAQRYGVAYRKVENPDSPDYVVDHSSQTYVIDQRGRLHTVLQHGTLPDKILAVVRSLLTSPPQQ